MSLNFIVFLAGLFGVPIALLALGHRLRRRRPQARAMFRGAIIGHCIAGILAVVWAMIPPEAWEPTETARGFAGMWSLLLLPVLGALVSSTVARGRAAIAVAAFALPLQPLQQQQAQPALVGIVGHWTPVNDGGPALKVDGSAWSGQTARADLEKAARPIFSNANAEFLANHAGAASFPIAVWSGTGNFTEGTVSVGFKMIGGASDQNAGIVLGLQPTGEYLFVRYNTKDGDIAIWRFADGKREVIAHGEPAPKLALNAWHELTVSVSGNKLKAAVTGQPVTFEHVLDKPLTGRVGVWTKRDAITAFRNYRVTR
jgi:hypothetical protein